jgi:hypothetical protein
VELQKTTEILQDSYKFQLDYSAWTRGILSTMSVLLETSAGDIVIDLLVDYAPKLCEK